MRSKTLKTPADTGVASITQPTAGVMLPQPDLPSLDKLPKAQLLQMQQAAYEVLECRRVLRRGGLNIVGEILRGQGEFIELEHYPHDDVFDHESASQYYYHAHRGEVEHGHFHCFLRADGFPSDAKPVAWPHTSDPWPSGHNAICHLVAISMDAWGEPIGLFTTNRWVTDESWYPASDVIRMLAHFQVDHAAPSWPVNRWLSAMLKLYQPWIESLLHHRDKVIAASVLSNPDKDVLEDRNMEMLGHIQIDVDTLASLLDVMLKSIHVD